MKCDEDAQRLIVAELERDALKARVAELEQQRDDYRDRLDKTKARYFGLIDFCRGLKEAISEMEKRQ